MEFIKNNYLVQYILIIIFLFVSINIINNSTCKVVKENITIFRYNPNHKNFDLSDVIRVITQLIFCKPSAPSVVRVEF